LKLSILQRLQYFLQKMLVQTALQESAAFVRKVFFYFFIRPSISTLKKTLRPSKPTSQEVGNHLNMLYSYIQATQLGIASQADHASWNGRVSARCRMLLL
jgi:hypothetical protein